MEQLVATVIDKKWVFTTHIVVACSFLFYFQNIVSAAHSMHFAKSHLQASDFASLYHDSHLRCLTLLRNYHDQLRRSPIMQACWLSCAHCTKSLARQPAPGT